MRQKLVFVLCSEPKKHREQIIRFQQRYIVRLVTSQDVDTDDLRAELSDIGQEEALFIPIGPPDEWGLMLQQFTRDGEFTSMVLVV